jgi:hypothetical protein
MKKGNIKALIEDGGEGLSTSGSYLSLAASMQFSGVYAAQADTIEDPSWLTKVTLGTGLFSVLAVLCAVYVPVVLALVAWGVTQHWLTRA